MNNSAPQSLESLWRTICDELSPLVSPDAVSRWFAPLGIDSWQDGVLVLRASNAIYQYWIEENYLPHLTSVAGKIFGVPVRVRFQEAAAVAVSVPPAVTEPATEPARPAKARDADCGLNARMTFQSFVVGSNSEFAHAAAHAAALAPARTYNPLFLHGAVGLGKTHLMQAVGNLLAQKKKNFRVQYVTCEQFTNDFISAIQHGELPKFRRRYRQVDALLIDDVQFLSGKERSQEEFFHTFNTLFDGSKQIVLTCDKPPAELAGLEKRLLSRFEWGLTAEIQPPDVETRLAILRHKSSGMPTQLSPDVLNFIASRVKSNVRRLEGALTTVAAFAAIHGKSLSLGQVETLLKDILQYESASALSIDQIQRKVAETFDIRLADMTSSRRPKNIADSRMVAMYLSRRLTGCSLNEIGQAFGGRDHGTVIHACKTVPQRMELDPKLRQTISYLESKLAQRGPA